MRYAHKTLTKRRILRFYGSLVVGLLGVCIMAGLSFAKYPKHTPKVIDCGDTITRYTKLNGDLNCDTYADQDQALTVVDGGTLDLNGYSVIGNSKISCIMMTGGATLRNGTVMNCKEGILIEGDRNKIMSVKASNNERRGFRTTGGRENQLYNCTAKENGRKGFSIEEGDDNLLNNCSAMNNGQQGFSIEDGDGNKIYHSKAIANCRDGIEIDAGEGNQVVNNLVEDNGNPEACEEKGEDYNPWFYAGIDVTNGSNNNEIKYNRACGNLGCVACLDEFEEPNCQARERNFWDENVNGFGDSISTNVWKNNRVACEDVVPEFSPGP